MTAPLPAYTIRIAIDSFKDKDSRAVYELPGGSSVTSLKAEIEATENIPVGHQRLVHNDLDLEDNESLDSLVLQDPCNTIVKLLQPRIYVHLERDTNESKPQVKTVDLSLDLADPIRTSLMWLTGSDGKTIDLSSAKLSVLGSKKRPSIRISDIDRSFLSYGILNGDVIDIVYKKSLDDPNQSTSSLDDLMPPKKRRRLSGSSNTNESISSSPFRDNIESKKRRGLSDSPKKSPRKLVRAKYSWDGETMTPTIKGLSLKRDALIEVSEVERHTTQPGWLYGFQVDRSEPLWKVFSSKKGYFPESFVYAVNEKGSEKHLETADTTFSDEIPSLPPFRFPPATGMEFHMPISDHGHSFLKLTANYHRISLPSDPTHVTFSLLCSTHDNRRVSSVSIFITIPESTVSKVEVCKNEAHEKEIQTDLEVAESREKTKHFDGANIGTHGTTVGFQGGISKKHSIDYVEKGIKISRRIVNVGISKKDTIFWKLKAPMTNLDGEGLNGEESITLILMKKPAKFKYECRVTHVKDGIKKTTERIFKN
ncbi:hypothetical protein Clacol_004614 [Clathrus columnatus]|uniref:Ubiquitin-like domain-containing protein n=1 Tax=Clathrus columnatus TaxID=1419009 RepID=A0AAV5AB37_9AGAM|nr:hypothetical protein Clacol_004614 [Clathrus columnatus]